MTTIQQEFQGTAASDIIARQSWANDTWSASDDEQVRDIFWTITRCGNNPQAIADVIRHIGSERGWRIYRDIGPSPAEVARVRAALN